MYVILKPEFKNVLHMLYSMYQVSSHVSAGASPMNTVLVANQGKTKQKTEIS